MRPLHYGFDEYLERLAGVYAELCALPLLGRRLALLTSGLARGVVIARTAALRVEFAELNEFRAALRGQADMRRFYEGRSRTLPAFLAGRMRGRLGCYAEALPREAQRQWAPAETAAAEAAAV
jgi:hypothetical protein